MIFYLPNNELSTHHIPNTALDIEAIMTLKRKELR